MLMETIEKRSAGGIIYCNGRFLAIRVLGEDEVVFPKGTIEVGETPEQAAVRELAEETGYHVKIVAPLGEVSYEFEDDNKLYRKTVYHYLFELIDRNEEPKPSLEEHEDFENLWLDEREALTKLTHDNSKNILKKALVIIAQRNQ